MDLFVKIFFALPVYQSFILAIILFTYSTKKHGYSRKIMGLFQFVMAIYFSFNFLYSIRAYNIVAEAYFLIIPVILLFAPVFYLFILSVSTPGFRLHKKHLMHFLPSAAFLLLNLPYLFFPDYDKLEYISHGVNPGKSGPAISYLFAVYMLGVYGVFNVQIVVYSIKAYKKYRKHRSYIGNHFSYTENVSLNWTLALIVCFILLFAMNAVLYLVGFKQHFASQIFYNISMLAITLFAGYRGMLQKDLLQPEINPVLQLTTLSEIKEEQNEEANLRTFYQIEPESTNDEKSATESHPAAAEKYAGSGLTQQQKMQLIHKLENLMTNEKIFINSDLSIEDVALRLDTRTKNVSQIINEHYQRNFYNFINQYRIAEAQRLLNTKEFEKYSILGIAQSVGFVSKSTFNTAFKRHTGVTPSEFKQKQD
jgi:AraC-like DNA-binding protein